MRQQSGFTLIELVIFIAVVGIIATSVMFTFNQVLVSNSSVDQNIVAIGLAKQRMELILGERRGNGFAGLTDPCTTKSAPSACILPTGFSITQPTIAILRDPNFKKITVKVTGAGHAEVISQVANY